jgi:SAM-dependent methyltransferase
MTAMASDHAREAYDALAPGYDQFTAHHDQARWTALILELAAAAGLAGSRVLDVGCGTGSAIPPMLDRGYAVTGVDISPAMIAVAAEKVGARAELHVGDMRDLPVLGRFDLVWALCDAVNYLHSHEELAAAFAGMRRSLAPGGIVAFDTVCLGAMRAMYGSVHVVPGRVEVVVYRGEATTPLERGGLGVASIEHLRRGDDGAWTASAARHRQRHHPPEALEAALRAAALQPVGMWGTCPDGTVGRPVDEERHTKLVTIARAVAP